KYSEEIQKQKDDMDAEFKGHEQKFEKQIQSVDKELKSKKNEFLNLSKALPQKMNIKVKGKEKEIVKTGLFKSELKETGNWIVGMSELKRVQGIVNAAYVVKKDYER
ncbi:mob protein, partial [Xenorhabdus sp. Vera]|nr:mob protein [Xenorhabdus sp. Vera]